MTADPPSAPGALTDEQVVARVRAGEHALFEVVMRRHNQRIYRAARAIVKDEAEAEDVMQEAYVRAFEHLGDFEGRARFSTWLTRIAVHEALARLRRRRRDAPAAGLHPGHDRDGEDAMSDIPAQGPSPEQRASERETQGLVERAIDTLPEGFRVVFVLRVVEELSVAETAEALGIAEETVKTRLHRARAALQREVLAGAEAAAARAFPFHAARCDRVVAAVLRRVAPAGRRGGGAA